MEANLNETSFGCEQAPVDSGNSFAVPMTIGASDAQPLSFETAGTTRMTIDTIGNVGIGTNTPGFPFHVFTADGDINSRVQIGGALDDATQSFQNGTYTITTGLSEYLPHNTGTEDYGFSVHSSAPNPLLMGPTTSFLLDQIMPLLS